MDGGLPLLARYLTTFQLLGFYFAVNLATDSISFAIQQLVTGQELQFDVLMI